MVDLHISPQAEMDLDQIWLYIARESKSTERAERFLDRFSALFSNLARNPYLGRSREDLRPGYRSFPLGDYVILYRLTSVERIMVLRIVHGTRDLGGLFL